MRKDRFFVDFEIKEGKKEIKKGEIFHRIKNVLRKKEEEIIIFVDGKKEAEAKIEKILRDKIFVEISKIKENEREPKIHLSLFCCILKKSNFEFVVQKATEIGVKEIFPIISKNTVKLNLNFERLKKIAKSATEQSNRITLPKIGKILSFEKAIEKAKQFDLKILFDTSGKDFSKIEIKNPKNFAVFVGPEGGWDKKEIEISKKENFKILNLGKLNLKSETAAILGSFLIINKFC